MTVRIFPTPEALLPDSPQGMPGTPTFAENVRKAAAKSAPARPTTAKRTPGSLLDDLGFDLMLEPGHGLVLEQTAATYPHIVNKLAVFWNDAEALDAYLNQLLFADRPDRAGLDFKVAAELAEVRNVRVQLLRNVAPKR